MRFGQILVMGPVLLMSAGLAFAAQAPAELAAEILARAQTIDLKCHYLTPAERDQMSTVVAQAELALAGQESTDDTKATMARGHDAGMAAACSNKEQQAVSTVLHAALDASTPDMTVKPGPAQIIKPMLQASPQLAQPAGQQSDPQLAVMSITPYVPKMKPEPDAAAAPVKMAAQKPAKKTKPDPAAMDAAADGDMMQADAKAKPAKDAGAKDHGLMQYAALTEQYYVARRCGSPGAAKLYSSIVALHNDLMQSHSAAAVSTTLHQAESAAGARSCG